MVSQVPRLTAVLRGLSRDSAALLDPDEAFIQRQKALAARQQQQSSSSGSGADKQGVRSQLAQQLIGDWSKGE
jgi:hypothetical protein